MAESIFDTIPPDGTCRVRLKTKFPNRGNTPVILCDTLTHAAVEDALQSSESLRRYASSLLDKKRLGDDGPPWTFKAEMEFLGSDDQPIDAPKLIEFLYYGESTQDKKKKNKGGSAKLLLVMEERERSFQATVAHLAGSFQATVVQMAGLYKAAIEQTPNAALIDEVRQIRVAESQRANDATKDVATLLQQHGQTAKDGGIHQTLAHLAPWAPVLKSLLPN